MKFLDMCIIIEPWPSLILVSWNLFLGPQLLLSLI